MVDINTEVRTPGVTTGASTRATPARACATAPTKTELTADAALIWQSMLDVAGAQLEIWGLKIGKASTLACLGMTAMAALLGLGVYGFILLDRAFGIGLANTDMPAWFSPLVRGALYFGLPLGLLALGWHTMVGYGTAEKDHATSAKED